MTGIDRLRAIAGAWDEWGLGGSLTEIADEIEREQGQHVSVNRVLAVASDMERHCLGHEGMEDSPVARWARELREALKSDASDGSEAQNPSCVDAAETADVTSEAQKVTRDPAEDVSMSAYDLLPADERDAIAWVRKHGGLGMVRRMFRDADSRRVELCDALSIDLDKGWSEAMAAMRLRLMPVGMEWPRYESGEPVGFGDEVSRLGEVFSISLYCDGSFAMNFWAYSKGERVKRPSVLASDGERLAVGQTVYDVDDETDTPLTVVEVSSDLVRCEYTWKDGKTYRPCYPPSALTHTKPEPPDSWDALWDDIEGCAVGYESFMRRAKALAERDWVTTNG